MPLALVLLLGLLACSRAEEPARPAARPSFLVVVIDTLRADAVSAYGAVAGTTPELDALAAEGLLYEHAFAPSPWTLPSHATLLTGLDVEAHGVGLAGRMRLPDAVETLATRLARAGYETAAFSENPIVSHHFGLERGFGQFASALVEDVVARDQGFAGGSFDVLAEVRRFVRERPAERPFFLFVNLYDPHDPYELGEESPFLPAGVGRAEARAVLETAGRLLDLCERLPPERSLAILKGLYLGEVKAADAKLGALLRAVRPAAGDGGLVTLVTSDHGEHLGEHGLLGHEFSVRNVLLQVPLVVHGLPDTPAASVETPVALVDLAPSILGWAEMDPPASLGGRALPERRGHDDAARDLLAVWSDAPPVTPASVRPVIEFDNRKINHKRIGCLGSARVFGDLVALTRYPDRLVWFEEGAPELYDLERDPGELEDRAAGRPERARGMEAAVRAFRARAERAEAGAAAAPDVSPEAFETLRALGYVE